MICKYTIIFGYNFFLFKNFRQCLSALSEVDLSLYKYFGINDLNLINLFILVAIEISFFTWSFLSYKTNLSDWIVRKPQKGDVIPIFNMFIFYFFIVIYYSILS